MDPRYKSPTANVDLEAEDNFRDLESFTNVLKWMLWIGALFWAFGILSAILQLQLLSGSFTQEQGSVNDLREAAVGGFNSLFMLVTIVVFGRWIVLAHRNLPALGARVLEIEPGWAVGWFFVPLVNLWFPYQGMRFLWRASHSVQRPELQDSTWVLPVWWGLWIAFLYLPAAASVAARQAYGVDGLMVMTQWEIVNRLVNAALYIVASLVVTRIWEAQRTQHENPREFDPAPGFADS